MQLSLDAKISIRPVTGTYLDWGHFDYTPAVTADQMRPEIWAALEPFVSPGQAALDVGSEKGSVACLLASEGLHTIGIDLNPNALERAGERARDEGIEGSLRFVNADFLEEEIREKFDVVSMIRLLTCFSDRTNWQVLLAKAYNVLRPGGIIYIRDFLGHEDYHRRYVDGRKRGWRLGDFAVNVADGELQCIAHHHSEAELAEIIDPYYKKGLRRFTSVSMNGNMCNMFEFIGAKPQKTGQ